ERRGGECSGGAGHDDRPLRDLVPDPIRMTHFTLFPPHLRGQWSSTTAVLLFAQVRLGTVGLDGGRPRPPPGRTPWRTRELAGQPAAPDRRRRGPGARRRRPRPG